MIPNLVRVLAVYMLLSAVGVDGHQKYQLEIPNGASIKGGYNQAWPGVGHERSGGSGPLNPFGKDFLDQGTTWTKELCEKDSDGDGISNGVELGDPKCVWKKGDKPQFDTGLTHPGFSTIIDSSRGQNSCEDYKEPEGAIKVDLKLDKYAVLTDDTTYVKFAFNFGQIVKDLGYDVSKNSIQAIRFEPIIDNENVVHHLLVYACDNKPVDYIDKPTHEGVMPCYNLRYAWAVGGAAFCLPKNLGVEFSLDPENSWQAIEIHYDNPQERDGIFDSSGARITLVIDEKDEYTKAGFMWLGSNLPDLAIPPKVKDYNVKAVNQYPQIPKEGVSAFAYMLHAHTIGRQIWSEVRRGNEYLHDIGCNTQYDFDLQEILPFDQEFKIYSDDELITHCVYDSTNRNTTTYGGESTTEEMCINFVMYYPEIKNLPPNLVKPTEFKPPNVEEDGAHHVCKPFDLDIVDDDSKDNEKDKNSVARVGLSLISTCAAIATGFLIAVGYSL